MKEKDLERSIENLIIKGLLKEAEQENADFEAALRKMSHEDFMDLLDAPYRRTPIHSRNTSMFDEFEIDLPEVAADKEMEIASSDDNLVDESIKRFEISNSDPLSIRSEDLQHTDMDVQKERQKERKREEKERIRLCAEEKLKYSELESEFCGSSVPNMEMEVSSPVAESIVCSPKPSFNRRKKGNRKSNKILPWFAAGVVAASIILAVLIPSYHSMEARLCDSALYASAEYITPSKGGFDVATASPEEIKRMLPSLEKSYEECILKEENVTRYSEEFPEAAWNLAVAYLKIHKKKDAVNILELLADQYSTSPLGIHCAQLLKQLK